MSLRRTKGAVLKEQLSEEGGSHLPVARSVAEPERQVSFHLVAVRRGRGGLFQVSGYRQTQFIYRMIQPQLGFTQPLCVLKQERGEGPLICGNVALVLISRQTKTL